MPFSSRRFRAGIAPEYLGTPRIMPGHGAERKCRRRARPDAAGKNGERSVPRHAKLLPMNVAMTKPWTAEQFLAGPRARRHAMSSTALARSPWSAEAPIIIELRRTFTRLCG